MSFENDEEKLKALENTFRTEGNLVRSIIEWRKACGVTDLYQIYATLSTEIHGKP